MFIMFSLFVQHCLSHSVGLSDFLMLRNYFICLLYLFIIYFYFITLLCFCHEKSHSVGLSEKTMGA